MACGGKVGIGMCATCVDVIFEESGKVTLRQSESTVGVALVIG